jgi:hypothetical protein
VKLTVDATSGPFKILSPNSATTFAATNPPTITWDTANTNAPPVNCTNVDIDLLTFSSDKTTYSVINVAAGIPNNGSATIGPLDDASNAQARFRVSCSDNVFYDVSDADLNITGTGTFATTGNTTALASAGICGDITVDGEPTGVIVSSGGGGGSLQRPFLLLLAFIGLGGSYYKMRQFRVYT